MQAKLLNRKPFTKAAQLQLITTIQSLLDMGTPIDLIATSVGVPLEKLAEYAKAYETQQEELVNADEFERCDLLFREAAETPDTAPQVTLLTKDNGYSVPAPSPQIIPSSTVQHTTTKGLNVMTSPVIETAPIAATESSDTVRFCDHFQDRVNFGSQAVYLDYTQYMDAIEAVATSQIEVNDTRVKSIKTSIAKKRQLIQAPRVVQIEGEDTLYMGGGRHRGLAVADITTEYVLTNGDKVVEMAKLKEGDDYRDIEFVVKCQLFVVPDRATMIDFILTDNGSRSVSAFENAIAEVDAGSATPLVNVKLSLGKALFNSLIAEDIEVTPNTCFSIAGSALTKVGPNKAYATAAQVEQFADDFAEFVTANPQLVPANFARDFKGLVDAFLNHVVVYEDSDGDEVDGPYVESWSSRLVKPVKSVTKAKKVSKKQAEMMAQLQSEMAAALGLSPEELQEAIATKRLAVV